MTIDRSIEEPCETTSLMHGSGAERRGRPLRLGNKLEHGKHITLTDGCGIGCLRLVGNPKQKLKRFHHAVSRKQKKSSNRKRARKQLA